MPEAWANLFKQALRTYFVSGWALFIPYLLTYLLYAWLALPANPDAAADGRSLSWVPSLLTVYWILHSAHVLLAASALVSWWKDQSSGSAVRPHENPADSTTAAHRPSSSALGRLSSVVWRNLPWICLTLVFAIPGVYLEWPSDPWEHLRRITEWQTHASVSGHSAGYKGFYFFAYSLVGWMPPGPLLPCINIYFSSICLCLAWQYYLLGRAVGLDARWAIAFVAVGAVTFGNSSFSYYRYYGLATTIFAQIGAVALTRMILSWVAPHGAAGRKTKASVPAPQLHAFHPWSWLSRALSCTLLLALIATSHVQGLGFAALGVAAIVIWRLIEWRRSTIFWIFAALALLNVAVVVWWPRHVMIETVFRPFGWMNAWYGFDILSVGSGAFERSTQIFGLAGLLNLFAGLWLLRRNEIVGWLTVMPVVALLLPAFAIPFANKLAGGSTVIVFHRAFLAVPSGLAFVCLARACAERRTDFGIHSARPTAWAALALILALLASVTSSPQGPIYSRLWHLLAITPGDLSVDTIVNEATTIDRFAPNFREAIVVPHNLGFVTSSLDPRLAGPRARIMWKAMQPMYAEAIARVHSSRHAFTGSRADGDETSTVSPAGIRLESSGRGSEVVATTDFPYSPMAYQNLPGKSTELFATALLPIEPGHRYAVQISVRRPGGLPSLTYLAVAWHDASGRLLKSSLTAPDGAGEPPGWGHGTYTYFGLIGKPAPTEWTTYRKPFGGAEPAAIPSHARYVRVGALLNHDAVPGAVTQVTNVALWSLGTEELVSAEPYNDTQRLLAVIPSGQRLFSPGSQAAALSQHWSANKVAIDLAAAPELAAVAMAAGYKRTHVGAVLWWRPVEEPPHRGAPSIAPNP